MIRSDIINMFKSPEVLDIIKTSSDSIDNVIIIIIIIDYKFAGHEGLFESLVRYAL